MSLDASLPYNVKGTNHYYLNIFPERYSSESDDRKGGYKRSSDGGYGGSSAKRPYSSSSSSRGGSFSRGGGRGGGAQNGYGGSSGGGKGFRNEYLIDNSAIGLMGIMPPPLRKTLIFNKSITHELGRIRKSKYF